MKKFFTIRLHLLAILAAITIVSCTSDTVDTEPVIPVTPQTRAIPTPTFDWANAEWMPVPAGQSAIPSPWNGAGSISYTYGMDITNDRYPNAGWELLYNTFDANASGPLVNPYFVLYNKYRGILRIYLYLTTEFVATSSYLQPNLIAEFFGKGDHRSGRALCNNRLHPNPRLSRQHQPDGGKQMVHDAV